MSEKVPTCQTTRQVPVLVSRTGICHIVRKVGTFILHTASWNLPDLTSDGESIPCPGICLVVHREESFSYTPRAAVCLVVKRVGSFSYTPRVGICLVVRREGVSLTRPVLLGVSSRVGGEFLLHAQ